MTKRTGFLQAPAYLFTLLIESTALANGCDTSHSGLLKLTDLLNDKLKEEVDEKYFRKVLIDGQNATDPNAPLKKSAHNLNALARFAGYASFHHFKQESAKVSRLLNSDLIAQQEQASVEIVSNEKTAQQCKKTYDSLWSSKNIQASYFTTELLKPEALNGAIVVLIMDSNRLAALQREDFTSLLSSLKGRMIPLWQEVSLAEAQLKYPVFEQALFLDAKSTAPLVMQQVADQLSAAPQTGKSDSETSSDQIQQNNYGSGPNIGKIGKIEGKYISYGDQHFNNPS